MYMECADYGTRGYPKNIWYSRLVGIDGITERDLKQERVFKKKNYISKLFFFMTLKYP